MAWVPFARLAATNPSAHESFAVGSSQVVHKPSHNTVQLNHTHNHRASVFVPGATQRRQTLSGNRKHTSSAARLPGGV